MNIPTPPALDPNCDFKYWLIMSHLTPLHQWLGSPRDLGREFATLSNFEIQARRFSHKLWGAFTPDTGSILYCRSTHRSAGDKREKMYVMLLIHMTKPRNIHLLHAHAVSFQISSIMSSGGRQQWPKCWANVNRECIFARNFIAYQFLSGVFSITNQLQDKALQYIRF